MEIGHFASRLLKLTNSIGDTLHSKEIRDGSYASKVAKKTQRETERERVEQEFYYILRYNTTSISQLWSFSVLLSILYFVEEGVGGGSRPD